MEVPDDVLPLLDEDEKVLFNIKQKKVPAGDKHRVGDNHRQVGDTAQALDAEDKKGYVDYSYADITNIVLDKGPLGSTIMPILKMDADDLVIEDIPNDMAQQTFRLILEGIDQARTADAA